MFTVSELRNQHNVLNDLENFFNCFPVLFKYADDSTILSPITRNQDLSADLVGQSSFSDLLSTRFLGGRV